MINRPLRDTASAFVSRPPTNHRRLNSFRSFLFPLAKGAAWAVQRLLAAAATRSATGAASPRPDRTSWLGGGRVNLLCHGRARASFSLTLRAGAMRLERIGRLGGAAAAGGGRDALSYGVSFATTRSHQLARGVAR